MRFGLPAGMPSLAKGPGDPSAVSSWLLPAGSEGQPESVDPDSKGLVLGWRAHANRAALRSLWRCQWHPLHRYPSSAAYVLHPRAGSIYEDPIEPSRWLADGRS